MRAVLVVCDRARGDRRRHRAAGGGAKRTRDAAEGDARSFMMGISTLPRELNAKSYDEAFKLAGDTGEMVLIQRNVAVGRVHAGRRRQPDDGRHDRGREAGRRRRQAQAVLRHRPDGQLDGARSAGGAAAGVVGQDVRRCGHPRGVRLVRQVRGAELQAGVPGAGRRDQPLPRQEPGGARRLRVAVRRGVRPREGDLAGHAGDGDVPVRGPAGAPADGGQAPDELAADQVVRVRSST